MDNEVCHSYHKKGKMLCVNLVIYLVVSLHKQAESSGK